EQTIAGTMAAVVVVGRRTKWQIYIPKRFVDRDHRPHIGIARVLGCSVFPRLVTELASLRNRMERPELLSGPYVESEDVTAWLFFHERSVGNVRARDDDVLHDDGR